MEVLNQVKKFTCKSTENIKKNLAFLAFSKGTEANSFRFTNVLSPYFVSDIKDLYLLKKKTSKNLVFEAQLNPSQPSVAVHIKTMHLICNAVLHFI